MNDVTFTAEITSAKLTARNDDDEVIRRVTFKLTAGFDHELAEWLGNDAITMRQLLLDTQLETFTVPIDAYHAKATMSGAGNAEADVSGIAAVAKMVGKEDDKRPALVLEFEAFPEAKLVTFLAASLKRFCEIDLKRTQLKLPTVADSATGVKEAVDAFKATFPKGTTVTMGVTGEDPVSFEGSGQP